MNLMNETKKLIRDSNITAKELAKIEGIKLRWAYKFLDDDLDPSVSKVQKIYDNLNNAK